MRIPIDVCFKFMCPMTAVLVHVRMSDSLYAHRERENNQRFDQLALTLNLFRITVNNDIHGAVQNESLLLNSLSDSFDQLMHLVKHTSDELRNVMVRNASLTRVIGTMLLVFAVIWLLYHLF